MITTYYYVVLRLAPDAMRGELINIGIALFQPNEVPSVLTMAPLNKLRAIDASWDTRRLTEWTENIELILSLKHGISAQVGTLEAFGFCEKDSIGSFTAQSSSELTERIRDLRGKYVANKANTTSIKKERRTRLQTALRDKFKKMQVLGSQASDLLEHLVVQNVPVPGHDELKSDFVYKNGVYRLTQTLDYNVGPDSLHNKLAEACVKSTAADMAMRAYGPDTLRLAVFDVPDSMADAADSHIDLLHARGFEIFHFNNPESMANYIEKAAPINTLC